jgi:UDP-4-amino-4,6-dideoxy-N-acetyl-beta-L-altrosamine transaminase
MIPYGRQHISDDDVDAVVAVLRSDFLTQGPGVPAFEQAIASYCGATQAVAVNSATSALHVACLALGAGVGDWVWTSPVTFVASANCALYCGAQVDFVDIDRRTWCLSAEQLSGRLARAEREGRLPKIVIAVHLTGQPCDMAAIDALRRRYGFKVIEDASQALGARYRDEQVGNCRFSDITVFSFHPVKSITTAEGGVATTNDAALAERMARLRTHGITRDPAAMIHPSEGPWYYEQLELGFNYRLTDLHAALGVSQLRRLDSFIAERHMIAHRYDDALGEVPVTTPWQAPDVYSARHLYVVRLHRPAVRRTHREVFETMRASGIGVNLHYIPVYRQPYYARFGFDVAAFPEAEAYYAEAISLPIFPGLTALQQDQVVAALRSACAS